MNQTELQRAKEYALRSLTCREQTESELRAKLRQRGYDAEIAEAVISALKEYRYLDDARFTEQYVASHCHRWNRKQLQEKLYRKGIQKAEIDTYLELYRYDETALLQKEMQAYIRNKDLSDPTDRQKVWSHFMQKGYSYSAIREVLV